MFLYLVFFYVSLNVGTIIVCSCEDEDDCRNPKLDYQCSICNEKECIYPFSYLFNSFYNQYECTFIGYCGECYNNGTCFESFGEKKCICTPDFFGANCRNEKPPGVDIAGGVQSTFPWFVSFKPQYEEVTISLAHKGENAVVAVSTAQGMFVQQVVGAENKRLCEVPVIGTHTLIKDPKQVCRYNSLLNIRFPYVYYSNPGNSVKTLDKYLGYWAWITFTAKNSIGFDTFEVYSSTFKVYVSFKHSNLGCVSDIQLDNCDVEIFSASIYNRANFITIEKTVTHHINGRMLVNRDVDEVASRSCYAKAKLTWKVWLVDVFGTHDEVHEDAIKTVYEKNTLSFDPYSLDLGFYKILLEVKGFDASSSSLNFGYCYIQVSPEPLIVKIDQGITLNVSKEFGVQLTALQSKDPNTEPSEEGQRHVRITWYCNATYSLDSTGTTNELECDIPTKVLRPSETFVIPSSDLIYNTEFKLAARISTDLYDTSDLLVRSVMVPQEAYISVVVQPLNVSTLKTGIVIKCFQNCGGKVITNQIVFLKAHIPNELQSNTTYRWTYSKEGGGRRKADAIMVMGVPSSYLIIKENMLDRGSSYTIDVETDEYMMVSYTFETIDLIYNGSCTINPLTGIKGYTLFDITCYVRRDFTYQYEFYDKYADEIKEGDVYSGRMLGTSFSGKLAQVRLARGYVLVYIINKEGLSISQKIDVQLSDWNVTAENITELKSNLAVLIEMGKIPFILRYISVIPDIFPPNSDKQDMLNTLLDAISKVSVVKTEESKLAISTMRNIVATMNENRNLYLSPAMIENTLSKIYIMARVLNDEMSILYNRADIFYISPSTVRSVAVYILDCLYSAVLLKNNATLKVNEDFVSYNVLLDLRQSSDYAEDILDTVKYILSYLQISGQPPSKISSMENSYTVWAVMNDPDYPINSVLKADQDIPLSISDNLMNELIHKCRSENHLNLQVASSNQNIFWWSSSNVKSNLLSVTFAAQYEKGRIRKLKYIDETLDMILTLDDLDEIKFTGTLNQVDQNMAELFNDLKVVVHRLDPVPGSFTQITFLYPPTEFSLRVLIKKNFRPDFDMIIKNARTITNQSSTYSFTPRRGEDNSIYYMGILPGPEVSVNDTMTYSFEIKSTHCQTWSLGGWENRVCELGSETGNNSIHCLCKHLSVFSVALPATPHEVSADSGYDLFLTLIYNFTILLIVLLLLLLYLIASIWAAHQDSKDNLSRILIILEDNFPCDPVPYLVAVCTGSRFRAGTTAHVAIKLLGDEGSSRVHIFSCDTRMVLRRNSDDWFLVLSPKPLGRLYTLELWHDNYGPSPEWYCEKICVYDLLNKVETIFLVGEWLTLNLYEYPEAIVLPANMDDITGVKRTFVNNIHFGMRETHIVTSIMLRHARSHITRLARVNILMCCVMQALLTSVIMYKMMTYTGVDEEEYSISIREIVICILIVIINFIFIILITTAFQKSVKVTYERFKSQINMRGKSTAQFLLNHKSINPRDFTFESVSLTDLKPFKQRFERTMYNKFVRTMYGVTRSQAMFPVHLPNRKANIELRKGWYYSAWTICILIIFISSFVVVVLSLNFGDVQTKYCITSASLAIVGEIFILDPLKILLFSLLFSFALERLVEPSAYNVQIDDLKHRRRLLNENEEYYCKLLKTRSQQMYTPITMTLRERILEKRLWLHDWMTLVDFLVVLIFIIVLSCIIYTMWSSYYNANENIKQLLTLSHHKKKTINFYDIANRKDMETYLSNTFIRAVYRLRWYNSELIFSQSENSTEKIEYNYRTTDFTLKMIGSALVRQLRVKPIACNEIMNPHNWNCIPSYSFEHEDDTVYGTGWLPAKWNEVERNNSPWTYKERSLSWLFKYFRCYGKSQRELNFGGYMVELGLTRGVSSLTLATLEEDSWQDALTRAVIVELSLYNVNENLFSQVTLFVEYSATGTSFLRVQVYTLVGRTSFNIWDCVFIGFIVLFTFRSSMAINREGFLQHLSRENILQMLVVVLGCTVIILLVVHFYNSDIYLEDFESSGTEGYFDFDSFALYHRLARMVFSLLLFIAIIWVLCLLRCGRFIICCFYGFMLTLKCVILLTIIVIVFIVVLWRLICFILNVLLFYSLFEAFIESFNNASNFHIDYFYSERIQICVVFTKIFIKICMFMFVILFMYYTKVARIKHADPFNFLSFFISELKALSKYKKM